MRQFEVIQRGLDSSGRPLKNTRLKWAAYDLINGRMAGKLVIIQGAFMGSGGADASAGTHELAGCNDVRRWNLTSVEAARTIDIANEVGEIWWERTYAQGFDPHFHNLLPNDGPLHPDALAQVAGFNRGENGLASRGADTHQRPSRPLPLFTFQEDDMFEEADRKKLNHLSEQVENLRKRLNEGLSAERQRDQAERELETARNKKRTKSLAEVADRITAYINQYGQLDRRLMKALQAEQAEVLRILREDRATDGTPDDPSDEAVQQAEAAAQES